MNLEGQEGGEGEEEEGEQKPREGNPLSNPFLPQSSIDGGASQHNKDFIEGGAKSKSNNIRVICRFRPLNKTETDYVDQGIGFLTPVFHPGDSTTVSIKLTDEKAKDGGPPPMNSYNYDRVFQMPTTQIEMFEEVAKETITDVTRGYNGTIFTYGQSGSGKTHSMYGVIDDPELKGIIPRAIELLFNIIEESSEDVQFQLKFSIMQIYKEIVYDLLTGDMNLKIKESPQKGIYVEGLSEFYIDNEETFLELLQLSQEQRIVSGTKLNQYSSRSHTIMVLEVASTVQSQNISKKGVLNLVDLAGTEKVSKTGAQGDTLEEAKKINLSLSALGNVIHGLTEGKEHVPYRDSKLTRILQESLGGNHKTTLIVACSPHSYHLEETVSTLKFAQRAKTIKNKVKMNIRLTYEQLQKIVATLKMDLEASKKEITALKELLKGSGNVGENIITLIESQNVQNMMDNEIQKSNKMLLDGEKNDTVSGSPKDNTHKNSGKQVNIFNNNNPSSSVNIIINSNINQIGGEIDGNKKLSMMHRRSSFMDSNSKNNLKSLLGIESVGKNTNNAVHKVLKSLKGEFNNGSDSDHSSNGDSDNGKSSKKMKRKLQEKDDEIKDLEKQVEQLEKDNRDKNALLKESNKDILSQCRDLYEKLTKEIENNATSIMKGHRITPKGGDMKISIVEDKERELIHNDYNMNEGIQVTCNFDVKELLEKSKKIFTKFENILNELTGNNKDDDSQRLLKNLFNEEKFKQIMTTTLNGNVEMDKFDLIPILKTKLEEITKKSWASDQALLTKLMVSHAQYYLNVELTETFNNNFLNHNKILTNQNSQMLNIIEEMLTVNYELTQRLQSLHISFGNKKEENFSFAGDTMLNPGSKESNRANMLMNTNYDDLNNMMLINRNKMTKVLTKRNVGVMRTMNNIRRESMQVVGLTSLMAFQQANNINNAPSSSQQVSAQNTSGGESSTIILPQVSHFNANDKYKTHKIQEEHPTQSDEDKSEKSSVMSAFVDIKANSNPVHGMSQGALGHANLLKQIDKTSQQFNFLKEFVLKSYQENNKIKTTYDSIMKSINSLKYEKGLMLFEQNEDCSFRYKNTLSEENILEEKNAKQISDIVENGPSPTTTKHVKSHSKHFKPSNNKLEEIDENDELGDTKSVKSSYITSDENRKNKNTDSSSEISLTSDRSGTSNNKKKEKSKRSITNIINNNTTVNTNINLSNNYLLFHKKENIPNSKDLSTTTKITTTSKNSEPVKVKRSVSLNMNAPVDNFTPEKMNAINSFLTFIAPSIKSSPKDKKTINNRSNDFNTYKEEEAIYRKM